MKKVDIGIGISLIVLSFLLFWYAGRYREVTVHTYGPDLFPRLLAGLMIVLASSLIFKAFQGKSLKLEERIDPQGFLRVLTAIAICVGYVFLIHILGFAVSTFIFLFTLMGLLKQKGLIIRVLSSVITSLIIWAIFRYFLVIPLPEGIFF